MISQQPPRAAPKREEIMMSGSVVRRLLLGLVLAALCCSAVDAQTAPEAGYPSRPIRLIVPYTAGGPTDVMGRLMAQVLSNALGQQSYVENRPGAGSTLGGRIAATAEPDGYTLLVATAATLAIGPQLYPDAGLDPKVFVPIAAFATVPYFMIAGPKTPAGTVAEVIAYAKTHPGKLTFGVPNGAPPHMLAAWFKNLTATDILIVTYKGGADDLADLIGGHIDLAIETSSVVLPRLADGSVRALATASPARLPEAPRVPTLIESGVPDFLALSWTGLVGPPGTPQTVVEKVNAAINAGLDSPDLKSKLKALGAQGRPGTPTDFANFIAGEVPKWTQMVKLSGLHGE
jgi:tripartite-type tricarboxylate transporter receptor subunit TctC